jgi:hypothetical protein
MKDSGSFSVPKLAVRTRLISDHQEFYDPPRQQIFYDRNCKVLRNMKKKIILTFALCGLCVALVFAGARLYMLRNEPLYREVLNGEWFDFLTLCFWPSAFYLSVMQADEPVKTAIVVWSIAILANPVIYACFGWLVWRVFRRTANPSQSAPD